MRNLTLFLILLFTAIISSCTHQFVPALYHQDVAYQPKPASFDSAKFQTYASGGANYYLNPQYSDLLVSGQLNLSQGVTFKNVNLAYGAFGVAGDYNNGSVSNGPSIGNWSDKFFGAVGGRASADLYVNSGRFDFRYLGVEAIYSHEFGDYANFRQQIIGNPGFDDDPRTNLLTLGATTELIFHNYNDTNFENGIRVFLGGTFGHYNNDIGTILHSTTNSVFLNSLFPKASYFIKYKRYFGTVEVGSGFLVRFGWQF
jgi:hypothetical protein